MRRLEDLTAKELSNIYDKKTNTTILISPDITRFKEEIPNVNFDYQKEVPPTSSALDPDMLANAIIHTDSTPTGRYIRLVLFVYALGGKIFYREMASGDYEAEIIW